MSWKLYLLNWCLQILLHTNAMEKDDIIEFFLAAHLPFSVKRGEVINVPVSVYNPLPNEIHVTITLDNSKAEFKHMDFDNKVITERKVNKSIQLKHHTSDTIYFLITPIAIGNVTLKFKAYTSTDSSTVYETLNVVPEGITQFVTDTFLVNLKSEHEHNNEIALEPIKNLVPNSLHLEVGVVGDIMGLIFKTLGNLVRMPPGPVEQTMSSLLPNYLIMKYLNNSNHLTPIVEARLRSNLELGYQKLLNCRQMDGSFSGFCPSGDKENLQNDTTWMMSYVSRFMPYFKEFINFNNSGSSLAEEETLPGSAFLTSYVLRFLPHFKEFININEAVIEKGLAFLSKQQADNGTFTEKDNYLYPSQRNHVTLTGAALLAFLENHAYADKYLQNITKGLEFMGSNVENYKSQHIHALATYAFKQAKHAASEKIGLIKWLSETNTDNQSKWWQYVYLSNVEITSYDLLKLLELNSTKIDYILPAVKQLIAQRKSLSDFASTKDTVIGLIDTIKFAEFADYEPAKMDVNILSRDNIKTIQLTDDNKLLYKSVELPSETKSLTLTTKGKGSALVQIVFQYNTFKDQERLKPSFTIKTIKHDDKNRHLHLSMLVCVNYVGEGESSNMALLEIYTPSGYVIDDEYIKNMPNLNKITNIELKNSGTLLVVYFDQLYKNDATCVTLEAISTHDVAMHKPVPIVMYDYYNKDRKAVAFYNVDSKLCDICGILDECSKCT